MTKRRQPPDVAEMRRLYEQEGLPLREIAARFGLTHEGVRYLLLKNGTGMRERTRPPGARGRPINPDELRRQYVDEFLP